MGHTVDDYDDTPCPGCGDRRTPHPPSETCEFGKPPWKPVYESRPIIKDGKTIGFEVRDGRGALRLESRPTTCLLTGDELVLRYRIYDGQLLPQQEAERLEKRALEHLQSHCRHMRVPNGVCCFCGDGGG